MTNETPPQMAVTVELLPCPFCGGTDGDLVQSFTRATEAFAFWSVECVRCGAEVASDTSQAEADEHWNTRLAQQSAATGGEGSGLPDYEAHARERQAQALYFLEPIPSPAHQQWAPSYLDWNDLRDEQKRIYYRRGAVAAERMEALTPTRPNDMARENERLREARDCVLQIDNMTEAEIKAAPSFVKEMAQEALAALSTTPSNPPIMPDEAWEARKDWDGGAVHDQEMYEQYQVPAPSGGVLSDPTAVHLNMLRGGIAKPSPANIWHLYGDKALIDAMPESAKALTNPAGEGGVREALLMVAIEKLAAIISDETPDDLTPSEVDDRRYRRATPILTALGMTIDGDADVVGWGFDWPSELHEAEKGARSALSEPKDQPE